MVEKTKEQFIMSLLEVYKLEPINVLLAFLHGELAVLFTIKYNHMHLAVDLSKKLDLSKSRLTSIIAGLKRKKFIKITKDELDKRKQIISLTVLGNEFISKKEEMARAVLNIYFEKMGVEKITTLTNLIEESVKYMSEVIMDD